MAVDAMTSLNSLSRLSALSPSRTESESSTTSAPGGFAQVLNGVLESQNRANQSADTAIRNLVSGESQDLHGISLAVAQADMSFRMILELRNRLADVYQEVSRMQI